MRIVGSRLKSNHLALPVATVLKPFYCRGVPEAEISTDSKHLLVYGADELLLRTRVMVLERAGFVVISTTKSNAYESIVQSGVVSMVILCHSLNITDCERALEFAEGRTTEVKVIVLAAGIRKAVPQKAATVVNAPEGPATLIEMVKRLLA